jgi:uncharacterized protein
LSSIIERHSMELKRLVLTVIAAFSLVFSVISTAHAQGHSCAAKREANSPLPFAGAYRTAGGALVSVLPSGPDGHLRITHFGSGRSHKLYPTRALKFQSASDMDSETPVAIRYEFRPGKGGGADTLTIHENKHRPMTAQRVKHREETAVYNSGDTALFGKLTLPARGKPPFKTVVFVHGSDPTPSIDQEWLPHLLASNGIATFVFDKRGTGCSKGQYVQHFGVLSDDVVAAVAWLQTQPAVDKTRVGLAGFSQGGWVAPLAALKDPSIKFVLVGYGLAMSLADEDRLEAPLKLKELGVDQASIAEYQVLNSALHQLAREGFKDWSHFEATLERFKDRPWLTVARAQPSRVGITLQMGLAQAKVVAPPMFENFFQPFYEPVPTLEELKVPMLWLIAADDIEAPPEPTIKALKRLRQQGKPFATVVFPQADHGMQEYQLRDGKRVRTKYAQGYFSTLLKWTQEVAGPKPLAP